MRRTLAVDSAVIAVLIVGLIAVVGSIPQFAHYAELQGGDVFHNIWTWNRNLANLAHGRSPLAANILFPDGISSLYSEIQVGNTLLYAVPWWLTGHDALAYGIVFGFSIVLNGLFAFKIANRISGNALASAIPTVIAAFLPYWFGQIEHVQAVAIFWALAPLYFALSFFESGERRHLIWFAGWFFILAAGASYNLTIFAVAGIVAAVCLAPTIWREPQMRRRTFLLAAVAAACVLPWSRWWLTSTSLLGSLRTPAHNDLFAMDLAWLFVPDTDSAFYSGIHSAFSQLGGKKTAFRLMQSMPGFVAVSMIVVCIFAVKERGPARAVAVTGLVLLAASFGSVVKWNGAYFLPNPVFILLGKAHLLGATRFIAHFAYVGLIFCAIAASVIVARRKPAIIATLLVLCCVEIYSPFPSAVVDGVAAPPIPAVYRKLATLPRAGAVFLPMPVEIGGEPAPWSKQFEYMRYASRHDLQLVNGITGLFPASYHDAMKAFSRFPSAAASAWMRDNNVRHVVVDRKSPAVGRIDIGAIDLTRVYEDADYLVFERPGL